MIEGKGYPKPTEVYRFRDYKGEVGDLDISTHAKADLYISKIESDSWIFAEDSLYHEARGIGRFLMDNLVTLADVRGWSITAFAYTDGRLSDQDVNSWLERKGFAYDTSVGELIRRPQQPDLTQPVVRLLYPE